ncbi:MAG TPA: Rrf2 family transcriptional regulator, partial [Pyrinomonadaceae bacterium]|nr:Rrf2 family transcriptional regulator [Pyrinomonadaceae bacterium]
MPASSRFAIAVHVLALMAQTRDEPVKSDFIASSVNTNPVVIRRILCSLQRASLVTSQTGAAGGSRLARSANEITLLEVYRAVEEGRLLSLHRQRPNPRCPVGMNIEGVLDRLLCKAEAAFEGVLAEITVDAVLRALRQHSVKREGNRNDAASFINIR